MTAKLKIGKYVISDNSPCLVIAEIGHNHQGKLEVAEKMIQEAALCGVQAVKFQKRFNRTLFTKQMYESPYDNENSFGKTYGEHREALEFGLKEYKHLKKIADKAGVLFLATAFDPESVDFLEEVGVVAYKIASADITNHPLIKKVAQTGKPVIISTGAASMSEVKQCYNLVRKYNRNICIMQCTSSYPCDPKDLNLNVIQTYRKAFPGAIIGYSGHDSGIAMPLVAYMLGARIIEKHFTLNRAMKGTDHKFSLEPVGLRKLARDLDRAVVARGSYTKVCLPLELEAKKKMGKSIVLARPMSQGMVIKPKDVIYKSPGHGIPPMYVQKVIGRRLKKDLPLEHILDWKDLQ